MADTRVMRIVRIALLGSIILVVPQGALSAGGEEIAVLEAELDLAYTLALSTASDSAGVLMIYSHRNWMQYREQECALAALLAPNGPKASFDCEFQLTAVRLRMVRSWSLRHEPRGVAAP